MYGPMRWPKIRRLPVGREHGVPLKESCAPAVLLGQIGTDDVGKTLRL